MSISTINNTTPDAVAWANLSCNSLNVGTVPVFPNVGANFQGDAENLALAAADGSFTTAIQFNLTTPTTPVTGGTYNFYPQGILDNNQESGGGILITESGVYNLKFVLWPFRVNSIDAAGNLKIYLKASTSGAPYVDIASSITYAITNATEDLATVDTNVYLSGNTTIQYIIIREAAAADAGSVIIPATIVGTSECYVKIQRLG